MHLTLPLDSLLPTFVPAGFADVGHSVVRDASSGENLVIVDSVQSLANHLEATLVEGPGQLITGLEALPFVRLTLTDAAGRTRTSSSLELPHRLASGWLCKVKEFADFQAALAKDILDNGIAAATFRRCPNSLLHGVFYSQLAGLDPNVAKSPRLLSAEVVAKGAQSITDGGVARDPFVVKGDFDWEAVFAPPEKDSAKAGESKVSALGVGYIVHRHQAFIAREIELSVYLAEGRIKRLPLPEPAREVLRLLARIKLALLLAEPLDLRAHCIFQVKAGEIPPELKDPDRLLTQLQQQLQECQRLGLLQDPPITEFELTLSAAKAKTGKGKGKVKAAMVADGDDDGEEA
ncbi:MAG: type I-G CRISPR-associated RAMP protein Csb1/Cas7g [Cyanobium sp.]